MDYEIETQEYFWEDDGYLTNILDANDYIAEVDERDEYPEDDEYDYENHYELDTDWTLEAA